MKNRQTDRSEVGSGRQEEKCRPNRVSAEQEVTREPRERLEEAGPGPEEPRRPAAARAGRAREDRVFHRPMERGNHRRLCGSNASGHFAERVKHWTRDAMGLL